MTALDRTHDAARRSWVETANGHPDFPLQNLPFGVFAAGGGDPRVGVAVGDRVLDLRETVAAGLLDGLAPGAAEAAQAPVLNDLMALGAPARSRLRAAIFDLLAADGPGAERGRALEGRILHPAEACEMRLPAMVGDYTDFYAGIHHAANAGRRRNPNAADPLAENYKFVPVGYHGRASSVVVSGTPIRRPSGQRKEAGEAAPTFGPSRLLDYELEFGLWIGPGNALGEPVPIGEAGARVWGVCLLNDLSARHIQRWETQPLGPFLGKNFGTLVSPWIVTPEALAPFRVPQPPRPAGDPAPLPYLWDEADQAGGAFDIAVEAYLSTARMRAQKLPPHPLSRASTTDLYWTAAQFVAHHTGGGCNLRPGDLLGSGTISGPTPEGFGSLNELTHSGTRALALPKGEERLFLEDGDEVIFRGRCRRDGFAPIGLGACVGRIAG